MEQVRLTGVGGWHKGDFKFGRSEGSFRRVAGQHDYSEYQPDRGYVKNRGRTAFTISGADVRGVLAADCEYWQAEREDRGVHNQQYALHYDCRFKRDGVPLEAFLQLDSGTHPWVSQREGEISLGARRIRIRSVHTAKGLKIPSTLPLGYIFSDEVNEIGGLDLNGAPKLAYLPLDPALREAAAAASLALAVLWDPGDEDG
jgi:hypothetical protein